MTKPDAKLIWIAIDDLHFLRRNPQYLSPHAMEALKASIQRDGFLAPVLLRPYKAGGYELLSGNHRVMAAKELGMKSVPAIISRLNDQQAQRVAVNLNTVHGEPNAELLAPFLAEIDEELLKTIHLDNETIRAVSELDADPITQSPAITKLLRAKAVRRIPGISGFLTAASAISVVMKSWKTPTARSQLDLQFLSLGTRTA